MPAAPGLDRSGRTTTEGRTIRGLRIAFADTPPRLRELESGWREKRRQSLVDGIGLTAMEPREKMGKDTGGRTAGMQVGIASFAAEEAPATGSVPRISAPSATGPSRGLRLPPTPPPSLPPASTATHQKRDDSPRLRLRLRASHDPTQPNVRTPPHKPPAPIHMGENKDDARYHPSAAPFVPIMPGSLVPTAQPVPIGKPSLGATIHVRPPTDAVSITLSVEGGRKVAHVHRAGNVVDIHTARRSGKVVKSRLRLDQLGEWSGRERVEWKLLMDLVERHKRRTPRVKLFLPVGQVIATCSSPPDIVVAYTCAAPLPMPTTRPQPYEQPQSKLKSAARAQVATRRRDGCAEIRARVVYSRAAHSLAIDTSTVRTDSRGIVLERFRTRRTLRLGEPREAEAVAAPVSGPSEQLRSKTGHAVTGKGVLETLRALGVQVSSLEGWSQAEEEGVRRLWSARNDWVRYDNV